jgi:carboxypeptidase Q
MRSVFFFIFMAWSGIVIGQHATDSLLIRKIYDIALTEGRCYDALGTLCKVAPKRLSGSPGAAAAVEWGKATMEAFGFDSVWLQPVMVPHWVRGEERCRLISGEFGSMDLNITTLGGSVATQETGITAEVIEVHTTDELKALGAKVKGKIVFFNRPMNAKEIYTFGAYGGCVGQRVYGADEASALGAVACIVRSMTLAMDDHPHTGSVVYKGVHAKIPAAAISTKDAEKLSKWLKQDSALKLNVTLLCETLPDVLSYNVIGEIKGSEKPEEIILAGGHLDAWDKGEGAHDDGAGCVHSMEAIRLLIAAGYTPKRSLRAVLFMNEENGLKGALEYAKNATEKGETHFACIESDRGGFTPRGFHIEASGDTLTTLQNYRDLLEPFGLHVWQTGGSGADISPFRGKSLLIGMVPDSQRYFDHHHADTDVFSAIHKRELELGSAAISALMYLLDAKGISETRP